MTRASFPLVLAVCAFSSVANANSDLDAHSADAQLVARVDIGSAIGLLDQLAALSASNRVALGFLRGGADGALGFKLADFDAWKKRGIDPTAPISISIDFDDADHKRAYRRLVSTADWRSSSVGGPVFFRMRTVVSVLDASAAKAFIKKLPLGLSWTGDSAENKSERRYMRLRVHKNRLLIDVAVQFFGAAHDEPASRAVLAAHGAPMPTSHFSAKMVGAASTLRHSGTSVWISSALVGAAGRMVARESHIAEIVDRQLPRREGPRLADKRCTDLATGSLAAFRDLAISAKPKPDGLGIETEVVFGGDSAVLAATFARAPNRLNLHRRSDASGWLAIWLADLTGLRALPRTSALKTWPNSLFLIRQCATHVRIAAQAFGWPMMLGAFVDDLAAIGPRGKLVAESFEGADAVINQWHGDPLQTVGALSATLRASVKDVAAELLGRVFANRTEERGVTWWGHGRVRPFLDGAIIGATLGGAEGKSWLAKTRVRDAPAWLTGTEIAAAGFDEDGISGLAAWEPTMSFLNGTSELRLRVFLRGDQLVLGAAIERQ